MNTGTQFAQRDGNRHIEELQVGKTQNQENIMDMKGVQENP